MYSQGYSLPFSAIMYSVSGRTILTQSGDILDRVYHMGRMERNKELRIRARVRLQLGVRDLARQWPESPASDAYTLGAQPSPSDRPTPSASILFTPRTDPQSNRKKSNPFRVALMAVRRGRSCLSQPCGHRRRQTEACPHTTTMQYVLQTQRKT